MQCVGSVLCHTERLVTRDVHIHLCRRLGARGQLELDLQAVDRHRLDCLPIGTDQVSRCDETDRATRGGLAQPCPNLATRALGQQSAIHVLGTPAHCRTGVDILRYSVLQEAVRGEDLNRAGANLLLADHPLYSSIVVDMGMRVDHCLDRPLTHILAIQRECSASCLSRNQRIHDDQAGLALDQSHVGQVQTTHLIDAVRHAKKPCDIVQALLPP